MVNGSLFLRDNPQDSITDHRKDTLWTDIYSRNRIDIAIKGIMQRLRKKCNDSFWVS